MTYFKWLSPESTRLPSRAKSVVTARSMEICGGVSRPSLGEHVMPSVPVIMNIYCNSCLEVRVLKYTAILCHAMLAIQLIKFSQFALQVVEFGCQS